MKGKKLSFAWGTILALTVSVIIYAFGVSIFEGMRK
jgi:hypothetical protein